MKRNRNKFIKITMITTMVGALALLLILVLVNVAGTSAKRKEYDAKISELNQAIEEQKDKTAELEELREYSKTREYIEDVARQKLGLIYPGEVLLKAEE